MIAFLLVMGLVFAGCSNAPRIVTVQQQAAVPVVIDTLLRVPLPEVDVVYSNPVTSSNLVLAPEVLVFEQKDSTGSVLKRFTLNNKSRTLHHEQVATTQLYRFVYATLATVRNDSVMVVDKQLFDGIVPHWLVALALIVIIVICGFLLYKTIKEG